ncbi:MAG TPA: L,D-transpeptidase [Candidatus Wallbacteria bacterium]|nr:L,D-transpeptidase [Candidatus Wallbacteria bacterium]
MNQGINSKKLFYVISSFLLLILIIFTIKVNYAISQGNPPLASEAAKETGETSKAAEQKGQVLSKEPEPDKSEEKQAGKDETLQVKTIGDKAAPTAGKFKFDPVASAIFIGKAKKAPGKFKFVIDKKTFELRLFKDEALLKTYSIAYGRNPDGRTKQKKGDLRTPEGHFYVQSIEKSDKWLHEGKFAYGPWFLRLKTPFSGIAIHGTDDPDSIGTKASEGCIRLYPEEITELKTIVEDQVKKGQDKVYVDIFADAAISAEKK